MEYEINKGVSKTELSIRWTEQTQFDEFRYRMLKENAIECIVSCVRSQLNEMIIYTYDITGMQSLAMQYEGKKFTKQEIVMLYQSIITTLLKSEEYFLDKNCFLLSEELIQYEAASGTYQLLYCPESGRELKAQLADLTEYVLNHTDYADKPAVALIYEVFKMMRDEHTTILEILTYIKEGKKQSKVSVMHEGLTPPILSVSQPPPVVAQKVAGGPILQEGKKENYAKRQELPSTQKQKEDIGAINISGKKVLFCGGTVVAGIGTFLALYAAGVLYISHTNRLDLSKFAGAAIVIAAVVIYACYKILAMEEQKKETKKEAKKNVPQQKVSKQTKKQPVKLEMPPQPVSSVKQVIPTKPQHQQLNQPVQQSEVKQPVCQPAAPKPPQKGSRYRLTEEKEKNGQQFLLYKFPYLIGKSHEQVDAVIYSDAVSKVHAEFIEEQGVLYLVDMSSTNGTYVNSKRLTSNERIAVKTGDHIQIADKEYLLSS